MSPSNNLETAARRARRAKLAQDRESSVNEILPEPHRRHGPLLLLPYSSEEFPTEYSRRLPEWRRRAGYSAYQEHWRDTKEYILVALGSTIGMSTFVYFPIHASNYGYGSFLYAYIVVEFLIGFPLLFLHLALGQFTAKDTLHVFSLVPLAGGVGISLIIYNCLYATNLNMQSSWICYLMYSCLTTLQFTPSFSWQPPWRECDLSNDSYWQHLVECHGHISDSLNNTNFFCTELFFHEKVLGLKGNCMANPSASVQVGLEINSSLVVCLLVVYCILYIIHIKGIKSVGKCVVVTLPILCVLLLVFTLFEMFGHPDVDKAQAAMRGMENFFIPDWETLLNFDTWFAAVATVISSLSLDSGLMIIIGSYARFQSSAHYHAFYICLIDVAFAILSGTVMCSHLGVLAQRMHSDIRSINIVLGSHTALHKYILYILSAIEELDSMPTAAFVFIFFFILLCTGIIKLLAIMFVILKPLYNRFPLLNKWRPVTSAVAFVVVLLLTLPFITTGTEPVFLLLTAYESVPLIYAPTLLALSTVIAFVYGYGLKRLRQDLDFMLHFYPNKFFCLVWYFTPIVLVASMIGTITGKQTAPKKGNKPLSYRERQMASWCVFALIFLPIVIYAIWTVIHYYRKGLLTKIRRPLHELSTPSADQVRLETPTVRVPNSLVRHGARISLATDNSTSTEGPGNQGSLHEVLNGLEKKTNVTKSSTQTKNRGERKLMRS